MTDRGTATFIPTTSPEVVADYETLMGGGSSFEVPTVGQIWPLGVPVS